LHCSDSQNPAHDDISVIRKWHTARGFTGADGKSGTRDDVGYHFFITQSGKIQQGRYTDEIGAHCEGENHDSIGICLSGKDKFMPIQFKRLRELLRVLKQMYRIRDDQVFPHNHFNSGKTCPNFELKTALETST
jgi:N-acetyl-anhydromuramyl-L-alanine amidase AmpD